MSDLQLYKVLPRYSDNCSMICSCLLVRVLKFGLLVGSEFQHWTISEYLQQEYSWMTIFTSIVHLILLCYFMD